MENLLQRILRRTPLYTATQRPLTLLIAPPGSGKSAAVSQLLDGGVRGAYVCCRGLRPGQLWQAALGAVARVRPELAGPLGQIPPRPRNLALWGWQIGEVIQRHCQDAPFLLVLDQYHCVSGPVTDGLLELIAREDTRNACFLLAMEVPPRAMGYQEMAAKGLCAVVWGDSLGLCEAELGLLAAQRGARLTPAQRKTAYSLTQGRYGLAEALLTDAARLPFSQALHGLIQRWSAERLASVTPAEQSTLARLSLMPGVTLDQIQELLGGAARASVERWAQRGGLFAPDPNTGGYRLFPLIQAYFDGEISPGQRLRLMRDISARAAETGGRAPLAVLLEGGGDLAMGKALEETTLRQLLSCAQSGQMEERIRASSLQGRPLAQLKLACLLALRGQRAAGERLAGEAARQGAAEAEVLTALGLMNYPDAQAMLGPLRRARAVAAAPPALLAGGPLYLGGAPSLMAGLRAAQGLQRLAREAEELSCLLLALAGREKEVSWVEAELALERGDIAQAARQALQASASAMADGQPALLLCAEFTLARAACLAGEGQRSLRRLERLPEQCKGWMDAGLRLGLDLAQGVAAVGVNRLERLPAWLWDKEAAGMRERTGWARLLHGRALLRAGRWRELLQAARAWRTGFIQAGNLLGCLETHLMEAAAREALEEGDALAPLREALQLAQPDGLAARLMEYAAFMPRTLHALQQQPLVRKARDQAARAGGLVPASRLSAREKQVLALALAGMTNRAIAQKLDVAVITVAKTLTRAYEKLQVRGRLEAAAKLSQCNLCLPMDPGKEVY